MRIEADSQAAFDTTRMTHLLCLRFSNTQVFPPDNPNTSVGCIVCKQDLHRGKRVRGYIAMLSVDQKWRRMGIGELVSASV